MRVTVYRIGIVAIGRVRLRARSCARAAPLALVSPIPRASIEVLKNPVGVAPSSVAGR